MGMFLSCFENCAQNMMILERVAYRRGERETYMNTIQVVIHGYDEGIEGEEEILQEELPAERKVRFRGESGNIEGV